MADPETTNPFRTSGPLRPEEKMFFGRQREIEQILQALRRPQSIAVVGERRIGKTSLFYQLRQQLGDTDCLVLTLESVRSEAEFFERIARRLRLGEWDSYADIEEALQDQPLTLLLDEFDKTFANRNFSADFFSTLRGWDGEGRINMVTSTRRPLSAYPDPGRFTSAFGNTFFPVHLGPLEREAAQELLGCLPSIPGHWPKNWQDQVLQNTEYRPWPLQRFGYLAWEQLQQDPQAAFNVIWDGFAKADQELSKTNPSEQKPGQGQPGTRLRGWRRTVATVPDWVVALLVGLGSLTGLVALFSQSSWLVGVGAILLLLATLLVLFR